MRRYEHIAAATTVALKVRSGPSASSLKMRVVASLSTLKTCVLRTAVSIEVLAQRRARAEKVWLLIKSRFRGQLEVDAAAWSLDSIPMVSIKYMLALAMPRTRSSCVKYDWKSFKTCVELIKSRVGVFQILSLTQSRFQAAEHV
jgi:hypothetical protein